MADPPPCQPTRFAELFEESAPSILGGTQLRDVVPQAGGRWPLTVVLLPGPEQGRRLTQTTRQLRPLVGPDHFLTGSPAAQHLTVRALEHRREHVPPDDPVLSRYLEAVRRAARQSPPLSFRVTGLTSTTSGVMAVIEPVDGLADRLAALLAAELGPDGWRETDLRRTIWYSSLVHFTGPIRRPWISSPSSPRGGTSTWARSPAGD